MLSHIIISLGLLLDVIAGLLIWRFGLPEEISRNGHIYLSLEQEDKKEKNKGRKI